VLSVDEDRKRIALGLKQMEEDPWETRIPEKYKPGTIVKGTVTKITNFGVFVELEDELEGLLHVSELGEGEVDNPEEIVNVGEEIDVRILRVDTAERKIGLSLKLEATPEEIAAEAAGESAKTAPREELKGGMGEEAGPLFTMPAASEEAESEAETAETATEEGSASTSDEESSSTENQEPTDGGDFSKMDDGDAPKLEEE
jgi:small subunit ribosomal protein S1